MENKSSQGLIIGVVVLLVALIVGFWFMSQKKAPAQIQGVSDTPKSFNLTDVSAHNSESDCWMAINGKVYNVTSFIPQHFGGKIILSGCGKDASDLFNQRPTNSKGPHPESALKVLEKLYVGELSTQ